MSEVTVAVVSDIHFAAEVEKARKGHEMRAVGNPVLQQLVALYRRYLWLRDSFAHNHLVDFFVERAREAELVIGNGDFSCDTAFVGVVDDAAMASASECLGILRSAFGERFTAVLGDHELGKKSIFGGVGGMRLDSWERVQGDLGLKPFWRQDIGEYCLLGVTSSLIGLPVYDHDMLDDERPRWDALRREHLASIQSAFASLAKERRVILFCHDPSALPFLGQLSEVAERMDQIECTVIGHLHSNFIVTLSRLLAGMPPIRFLGTTVRRHSEALRKVRLWRPFKVRLCPSLAGIELMKDGGFLLLHLDTEGRRPLRIEPVPVPREGLKKV